MRKVLSKMAGSARLAFQNFRDDERGVAAIEFAFIAPLLITLWLGTMEISQGIEVNKKVGRSASMIGDLITQSNGTIAADDIKDIMKIGAAVLQPYKRAIPEITVTAIKVDAALVAKVHWSRRGNDTTFTTPFAKDLVVTIPANLNIANTFLIKVETKLAYVPLTSWSIKDNKTPSGKASVNMAETYYLRPRVTPEIDCTGC
jgi:Flp pilus assembly protein TadG